jgi:hypothetical protein
MFSGWYELAMGWREHTSVEILSDDAAPSNFERPRAYEMLGKARNGAKTPEPTFTQLSLPSPVASKDSRATPDYFGRKAPPLRSPSSHQPPSTIARNWDPSQTFATSESQYQNPLRMHKT